MRLYHLRSCGEASSANPAHVEVNVYSFAVMAICDCRRHFKSTSLYRWPRNIRARPLRRCPHFSSDIWSSAVRHRGVGSLQISSVFVLADSIAALVVAVLVIVVFDPIGNTNRSTCSWIWLLRGCVRASRTAVAQLPGAERVGFSADSELPG